MKVMIGRLLGLAGMALLAMPLHPTPSVAQVATDTSPPVDMAPDPAQVTLTPTLIENFLASWKDVEALRLRLDQKYGGDEGVDEGDPLFSLGNYLDKPDAKLDIDQTLAKYSFSSFADWASVAQSVMLAFAASDPDAGPIDIDAEKKRIADEINADPALSAEEKQQALKELEEQSAMLADLEPLPGNVDVAAPYMDRIRALFEEPPQ